MTRTQADWLCFVLAMLPVLLLFALYAAVPS